MLIDPNDFGLGRMDMRGYGPPVEPRRPHAFKGEIPLPSGTVTPAVPVTPATPKVTPAAPPPVTPLTATPAATATPTVTTPATPPPTSTPPTGAAHAACQERIRWLEQRVQQVGQTSIKQGEMLRQKDQTLAAAREQLKRKDEALANAQKKIQDLKAQVAAGGGGGAANAALQAEVEQLRKRVQEIGQVNIKQGEMLRQKDQTLAAAREQLKRKDEALANAQKKIQELKAKLGIQ